MRAWALLAVPLLLTGCGVTRDGAIAPSVNDCVAALPVAQTLVGSKAQLEVLRRFSLAETQRVLTRLGAPILMPSDATPAERASIAAERAAAIGTPRPRGSARAGDDSVAGPRPCLVVYRGAFTTAALRTAPGHPAADAVSGPASGGYVLVITTTRHPRVLRAVVSAKSPIS